MGNLIGKAELFTLNILSGTATIAIADGTYLSGYISPNLQSAKVVHSADNKTTKSQAGITTTKYYVDEALEMTWDFVPEGTTIANAIKSAQLPKVGSPVVISGLPVIAMGAFADALNTGSGQPWIYEGNSGPSAPHDDKWTQNMILRRYEGITSAVPIVA